MNKDEINCPNYDDFFGKCSLWTYRFMGQDGEEDRMCDCLDIKDCEFKRNEIKKKKPTGRKDFGMFTKASKKKQKLRLLFEGPSGSGKTYSALTMAKAFCAKIAFIDTEFGSASLYADKFNFDVINLEPPFTPEKYVSAILEAEKCGYELLIIDSISHEWSGTGGCLDIQSSLGGKFDDWKKVTPRHKNFINAILQSNLHIIGCARTKSDYVMEEYSNKQGKASFKPVKVGTKTEQREGLEFEFTTIFRLNQNHIASVSKDRTSLFEGIDEIITEDTGLKLIGWLNEGEEIQAGEMGKVPEVDDINIYEALPNINTVDELNKYWLSNRDKVQDKEQFKTLCASRKEVIIGE